LGGPPVHHQYHKSMTKKGTGKTTLKSVVILGKSEGQWEEKWLLKMKALHPKKLKIKNTATEEA